MQEVTEEVLARDNYILFIHSPFCGTCHIAEAMLRQIETIHKRDIFYDMNASFFEDFMQKEQVKSVPCLLFKKDGRIVEKVYVFHSVPNIYTYLYEHNRKLFSDD